MWKISNKCVVTSSPINKYSVSPKNPPCSFQIFFPNGWEFLINFFKTYYAFLSTPDYKFLFSYLFLMKLCHTKQDHPLNFLHFTRTELLSLLTKQMTSHCWRHMHVCRHYKSSRFGMTCRRQRSTTIFATSERVRFGRWWTFLSILCELGSRA